MTHFHNYLDREIARLKERDLQIECSEENLAAACAAAQSAADRLTDFLVLLRDAATPSDAPPATTHGRTADASAATLANDLKEHLNAVIAVLDEWGQQ